MGRSLLRRLKVRAVLITRGEHGMWLLHAGHEGHLAATAREVADVTGAGDTVIATMALAVAAGANQSLALKADGTVVAWGGNPVEVFI